MTDIPQALVEKAAAALRDEFAWPPGIRHDVLARAVIAAVWPDVTARPVVLCSQCGEQPAAMVKVGTDDGWCVTCLDNAAEPGPPVVDRIALAEAMTLSGDTDRDKLRNGHRAAEVLAAGVITDAADVRRQTAEDIAAAIEAVDWQPETTARYAGPQCARLAREVGGDRG